MNYIKIADPAVIKALSDAGFSYIREKINNIDIAMFEATPELLDIVHSKFSDTKFIYSNKLHFQGRRKHGRKSVSNSHLFKNHSAPKAE